MINHAKSNRVSALSASIPSVSASLDRFVTLLRVLCSEHKLAFKVASLKPRDAGGETLPLDPEDRVGLPPAEKKLRKSRKRKADEEEEEEEENEEEQEEAEVEEEEEEQAEVQDDDAEEPASHRSKKQRNDTAHSQRAASSAASAASPSRCGRALLPIGGRRAS